MFDNRTAQEKRLCAQKIKAKAKAQKALKNQTASLALPLPFPWRLLKTHEVEAYRNLSCSEYQKCLDYAIKRKWQGWTCFFCPQAIGKLRKELTYENKKRNSKKESRNN